MGLNIKFYDDKQKEGEIASVGYIPVDTKARKNSLRLASSGSVAEVEDELHRFEEVMYADQEIPESTLRFSFGDLDYDPTQDTAVASRHNTADRAGGGTPAGYGGTWTKLRTKYTNIWDYTYVDNTLLNEFDNGNYSYEATPATRFWNDVEHNPIKVIASNTAGCESFRRVFQGCWAITEIWELDTSDALNTHIAFSYCKNLKKICELDCSKSTNTAAMFQYCSELEEIPGIIFPDDNTYTNSVQSLFLGCTSLKHIYGTINLKGVIRADAMCAGCVNLEDFTIENTNRVENFLKAFASCENISSEFAGTLDTSSATNMGEMFSGEFAASSSGHIIFESNVVMKKITAVPAISFSNATNAGYIFLKCDIQSIDATRLSTLSGAVQINHMFEGNRNCKSGMLDAYTALGTVTGSHAACFRDCGIDTPTGRAELEQIPASWGGLAT